MSEIRLKARRSQSKACRVGTRHSRRPHQSGFGQLPSCYTTTATRWTARSLAFPTLNPPVNASLKTAITDKNMNMTVINLTPRLATTALGTGHQLKRRPILTSRSVATLAIVLSTLISFAAPLGKNTKTPGAPAEAVADTRLPTLQALLAEGGELDTTGAYLGPGTSSGQSYTGNTEIEWDKFFTDKTCWNDLPAGEWTLESRTATELKYRNTDGENCFGIPTNVAKIRVNIKTGWVVAAEIHWEAPDQLEYSGSQINADNPDNSAAEERRQTKKELKDVPDDGQVNDRLTKSQEGSMQIIKKIGDTLEGKFKKPKTTKIGKSAQMKATVADYQTPTGLNIRLWQNTRIPFAVIQPVTEVTSSWNEDGKLQAKNLTAWAKANVVTRPNGDVIIKNIPMVEQGTRASCYNAAQTMILGYWHLVIPLEIYNAQWIYQFENSWESSTKEMSMRTAEKGISVSTITREIDAGRPVFVARGIIEERESIRLEWKKEMQTNPNFQIPDSNEDKKAWPTDSKKTGHASAITGYNPQKKIFFITEAWGEAYRNKPISYDELIATCQLGKIQLVAR